MKILAIFIDMLSGAYSNLCNGNATFNCMDEFLKNLGGTVYANCYTPAPDTPRSSACMWSGLYPKANNCTNRVKWPKDSMYRNIDNIWNVLASKGFGVNVFMDCDSAEIGLIPLTGQERVYTDSIHEFFEQAVISENSFNFFYFPDVHYVMDIFGYSLDCYNEGLQFQRSMIEEIFDFYKAKKTFDYIMIFSDHGFLRADESREPMIKESRIKTVMMIHQKGETELVIDHKLRSNLDLMPTLCEILNYVPRNKIDGISFFDQQGHDYVLVEDLNEFSVSLGQTVEHWCVVLKDGSKHWLECNKIWAHESSKLDFDEKIYESLICKKMCDYIRNTDLYPTFCRYKEYLDNHVKDGRYSNGKWFGRNIYVYRDIELLEGEKIVLYGAGQVGKDYYKQIKEKSDCEIMAWVDINFKECRNMEREIEGIHRLFEIDYQYILICIENEKIAKQIRAMLEELSICEDKILWSKPQIYREI